MQPGTWRLAAGKLSVLSLIGTKYPGYSGFCPENCLNVSRSLGPETLATRPKSASVTMYLEHNSTGTLGGSAFASAILATAISAASGSTFLRSVSVSSERVFLGDHGPVKPFPLSMIVDQ